MITEPLRQSLTDRRCEECDLYLYIEDRTPGGAITHYCCALGHHLFVDMWGAQIREVEPLSDDDRDDGGPAFPRGIEVGEGGMRLRDYFAAAALTGVLSNLSEMRSEVVNDQARFARDCYRMADAMIAERRKP